MQPATEQDGHPWSDYESVYTHFMAQLRAEVAHPNSLLVNVVRQTPFMKLGNAKDLYAAVRGPDELLNSSSYIARLTRLALGLSESAQRFVGA